jgi:hypothetical protein
MKEVRNEIKNSLEKKIFHESRKSSRSILHKKLMNGKPTAMLKQIKENLDIVHNPVEITLNVQFLARPRRVRNFWR